MDFIGRELCERYNDSSIRITVEKAILAYIDAQDYSECCVELVQGDMWSFMEIEQIVGIFQSKEEFANYQEAVEKWAHRFDY